MRSMVRQTPRQRFSRLAALVIAGAVGSLVLASTAWGAPTITRATPGNGDFWNTAPTFNISGAAGETITPVSSIGTVTPASIDGGGTVTVTGVPPGPLTIGSLSATDSTGTGSVNFSVDTVAPTLGATLVPSAPNGDNGWYTSLTVRPAPCNDDGGSGIASGCTDLPWATQGPTFTDAQRTITASDLAGNIAQAVAPIFKFDSVAPTGGQPSQPGPSALVAAEPVFSWTPGDDTASSGVRLYELEYKRVSEPPSAWQVIARVNDAGGVGNYSSRRDPALRPAPLPEQVDLEWRVRTIDRAGLSDESGPRRITIDPTIPPAPVITGGPSTPIRFTSPTFTWSGAQNTFYWDLTIPGRETPVRQGGGEGITEATLQSLSDGPYTFRVNQVTQFGQPSAQATRAFVVDTVPPAAPEITIRPPFPAAGVITFGWTAEPGAFARWQVNSAGGAAILGPADSLLNSVSFANLADGAYSFQVMQFDAAGNASATTVEPFTVTTPLAPGAPPANPRIEPEFLLPTQNAFRLRPKAGRTVPTRRPVLGWRKGPRGTRLYNVQIFKVIKKRAGAAPTVKKVYSGFPSKRQLRAPKAKMQPGACYIWRVWPYTGTRFTPKPLGISNFCVAKKSVLKKKAIQAARNKAAQRRK